MTLAKELKEAVSNLPSKEKDKLIFRLLKKDSNLANRLYFELVSGDTQEKRRKEAKKRIEQLINNAIRSGIHSPGLLLMSMRDKSGIITEHVRITKDKYGEIALSIFLLKKYLQIYINMYKDASPNASYTLNIYLVVKAFKAMILLQKLHKDYLIDFADDLRKIGHLFGEIPNLMKVAIQNGLDVNWLILSEIPDDIVQIEKDLRQRGYLR